MEIYDENFTMHFHLFLLNDRQFLRLQRSENSLKHNL